MNNQGASKKILGMEIQMDRKVGKLYLSQSRYIEKVLDRFNMGNCKTVFTLLLLTSDCMLNLVHNLRRTLRRRLMFLILVELVV